MKDPAMLWYWNDWGGGTRTLSRFLKGCYIDLLEAQFNSGPLSLEEIKTVLAADFGQVWSTLSKKFKKTEDGLFFNERMEVEKAKRQEFSNKQKERVLKRWNKPGNDSGNTTVLPKIENENENTNEIKEKGVQGEKQKKSKKSKTELEVIYPFESYDFKVAWSLWTRYKSEQFNFRYKSAITEQSALKDLCEVSGGIEAIAIKLINYAISKGWKGIYKIQLEENGSKQRKNGSGATDEEVAGVVGKHFAVDYKQ